MNIFNLLIFIYVLTKPFYIFKSGSLQFSDFVLCIAFLLFIILNKGKIFQLKSVKNNNIFLLFVICTFFVNFFYFILYLKFKFILSSMYFLFNYFAMILFFSFFENNNTEVILKLKKCFQFNLWLQLIFYLFKLGKNYDAFRYMGTFNDPNQYAYFILLSYSFIFLIDHSYNKKKTSFIYLILSIFLIYTSASTGMLFGIFIFLFFYIIDIFRNFAKFIFYNKNKIFFFSIIIIILMCFDYLFSFNIYNNYVKNSSIIVRVRDKLYRADEKNINDQSWTIWQERGYDKLILYPKYLIYGSGEGEYDRFSLSAHSNEIHATFPSILFYYGFLPFCLIIVWFYKKVKSIPSSLMVIYIALFFESFTLLNQRQALFWVIFMLAPVFTEKCISIREEAGVYE